MEIEANAVNMEIQANAVNMDNLPLVMNFSDIRVTNDMPPRASLIDLTMMVCGQNRDHAGKTLRNLEKADGKNFPIWKFQGQGQQKTPVGTASECIEYIMMLPGNGAKGFRVKWSETLTRVFTRFLDGDTTLIPEIEANAVNMDNLPLVMNFSDIRVTNDMPPRASLIDLTMMVCNQSRDHAGKTLRNIAKQVRNDFPNLQFPGKGQRDTPVGTASECIEYIMMLPGNGAKGFRVKWSETLTRVFGGDATLIPEIESNAVNMNPLNQFCRAEVDAGRVIENTAHVAKKMKLMDDMEILQYADTVALYQRTFDMQEDVFYKRKALMTAENEFLKADLQGKREIEEGDNQARQEMCRQDMHVRQDILRANLKATREIEQADKQATREMEQADKQAKQEMEMDTKEIYMIELDSLSYENALRRLYDTQRDMQDKYWAGKSAGRRVWHYKTTKAYRDNEVHIKQLQNLIRTTNSKRLRLL